MSVFAGKFPDITPMAVVAFVLGAVPQLLILFEVDLSDAQDAAVNRLLVLAGVLFLGDVGLRVGRNVGLRRAATMPDEPGHPAEPVA